VDNVFVIFPGPLFSLLSTEKTYLSTEMGYLSTFESDFLSKVSTLFPMLSGKKQLLSSIYPQNLQACAQEYHHYLGLFHKKPLFFSRLSTFR
jgi:hypothetical protein